MSDYTSRGTHPDPNRGFVPKSNGDGCKDNNHKRKCPDQRICSVKRRIKGKYYLQGKRYKLKKKQSKICLKDINFEKSGFHYN